MAALAAAAAVTTRLRIGSFVYANDYRHPLILAREVATLDHLSGGRVELGLGAGWHVPDYRQLGMPYDRPGLRIDRMVESLGLVKRLLAGERVTHAGPHYRLDGARLEPRPIQARVPILIGGGGKRILRIAAREADIVGLLPQFNERGRPIFSQASVAETARKVAIIREAAGSAEAFDRLELNVLVADGGLVGSGTGIPGSALNAVKSVAPRVIGGSPYVLYGSVAQVRELLLRRREQLGISYYVWRTRLMEHDGPGRRISRRSLSDQSLDPARRGRARSRSSGHLARRTEPRAWSPGSGSARRASRRGAGRRDARAPRYRRRRRRPGGSTCSGPMPSRRRSSTRLTQPRITCSRMSVAAASSRLPARVAPRIRRSSSLTTPTALSFSAWARPIPSTSAIFTRRSFVVPVGHEPSRPRKGRFTSDR